MVKFSIMILSYDDGPLVLNPVRAALNSDASSIVLIGGGDIPREQIFGIGDLRFKKVFEEKRTGKAKAISRAIPLVDGEIVFIVSGDIQFNENIFHHMLAKFDEDVGVVVPKVVPLNSMNIWEKSCAVLWDIHDSQLKVMTSLGLSSHGGELIAVRRGLLDNFDEVINDDAYICLKAYSRGLRVIYDDDSIVSCIVPSDFFSIIDQRRRINYGHIQLRKMGLDPMIMNTLLFNNKRLFFIIFRTFVKENRRDVIFLPVTITTEVLSLILAKMDYISRKNHILWKIVPRSHY